MRMVEIERSPLFSLYKEYSEYKFYFRRSHEDFKIFIQQYEDLRQKIDENIFTKCSRLQIQILDLLAVSNLASDDDVESVISSLENLKAVDNIYEKVKENIQLIVNAIGDSNNEDGVQLEYDYDVKPTICDNTDSLLQNYTSFHDQDYIGNTEEERYTVIKFSKDCKAKASSDLSDSKDADDKSAKVVNRKRKGRRGMGGKRKRVKDSEEDGTDSGDDDDYVLPLHHRNKEMDDFTDANKDDNDKDEVNTRRYHWGKDFVLANPDKSQFSCKKCESIFKDRKSCISHAKNVHIGSKKKSKTHKKYMTYKKTDDGKCICDGCEKHFDSSVLLRRHKTTDKCGNIENLEYVCFGCKDDGGKPLEFKTWREYKRHRFNVHEKERKRKNNEKGKDLVQCDECEKMVTRAHLPYHKKVVHLNIHEQCPLCGVIRRNIRAHMMFCRRRLKGQFFNCDQCEYRTVDRNALRAHFNRNHAPKEETHCCEICGKDFNTSETLKNHIQNVHSEKLQCPYCPKFFTKLNLDQHIIFVHKSANNICVFCSFEFGDKESLKEHMKQQHSSEAPLPPEANPSKLYVCEFNCGYTCFSGTVLAAHRKRKHTGIMIKCDMCDFSSVFASKVKNHKEQKHLGIKYPCKHCDFQSTSKLGLKHHMMRKHPDLHVEYSCHLCTWKTDNKDLMQRHVTNHGNPRKSRAMAGGRGGQFDN